MWNAAASPLHMQTRCTRHAGVDTRIARRLASALSVIPAGVEQHHPRALVLNTPQGPTAAPTRASAHASVKHPIGSDNLDGKGVVFPGSWVLGTGYWVVQLKVNGVPFEFKPSSNPPRKLFLLGSNPKRRVFHSMARACRIVPA